MEDDILEIDSPMEPAVDIEDEEEEEIPHLILDPSSNGFTAASSAKASNKSKKGENRHLQLELPESMPYQCETLEQFDDRVHFIIRRLVDCIRTKDYDIGLVQWNHRLQCLLSLKYPLVRQTRARLARFYYELAVLPGLDTRLIELAANMCMTLIEHEKKINIKDLVLPWKPLYQILEKELFPKQRRTGKTNIAETLLDLAEEAQRFFPASEADQMLKTVLPKMDGSDINSVIATQAFLVHFLPISHPQRWLPAMFRLWQSFNSSLFDDQMLDLLARLAEMHVADPSICSESSAQNAGANDETQPVPHSGGRGAIDTPLESAAGESLSVLETVNPGLTSDQENGSQPSKLGLFNEIGIFTEQQFALIMTKCLRSAGLPVGANKAANAALMAQSSNVRSGPDATASGVTLKMKKPTDRLGSFASIIVYSISKDGPVIGESHSSSVESTPAYQTPVAGSSPHLGPTTNTTNALQSYPAGSRALDHLAKFVQATEGYFHPSNWGMWQIQLSKLVEKIMFQFLKRCKEEERPDCKTPLRFRITREIKKEIVSILRTVCLLSMFSKDPLTIAASQASLKKMSILQPDLIFPAVLERAFNSLEALETTHRTTAIITALSSLSSVMVSRQLYPAGGKNLVPLLQLCIPGIDLNDPMKTVSTCMFILLSTLYIRIDDLTRPEVYADDEEPYGTGQQDVPKMEIDNAEGQEDQLSIKQQDYQLRLSTADFEPWLAAYFQKVLTLFEALPEEGKGGKTGGKLEEQVINMVIAASDAACCAMSPYLLEQSFKPIADYCASTVSANSVKVIGSLVSCFARGDRRMVLDKFIPLCAKRIEQELDHGASSTRTTSTSLPAPSDVAFHWHMSILIGAMSFAGEELLPHREQLLSLFKMVVERCKSERGFSFAARLVQKAITSLVSIYPKDQRFVNRDLWESQDFDKRSHLYWGKMYLAKDVKIDWHLPSDEEIDFCLEIFTEIVEPALAKVEQLQQDGLTRDKVWSNDFCRFLTVARLALASIPNLIEEDDEAGGSDAMDAGDEVPEFIQIPPRFKSGFILTDRQDSRYRQIAAFKARFGQLIHLAAQTTQASGAEDQIDCVKLLIRSIRTFFITYSFSLDDYKAHSRSLSFFRTVTKLYAKQTVFPRVLWIRRAVFYNTSRARLNSFHRSRTQLKDKIILQMLEFCMSNYVGIRITAQSALETISSYYDGTRILCLPKLFEALQPNVTDDRMKGALWILGSKGFSNLALVDARYSAQYILGLLASQHHSKPSIQKLVRGVINDFVIRLAEPSSLKSKISSPTLLEAADILEASLPEALKEPDQKLLEAVTAKQVQRTGRIDKLHAELTPKVLEFARNPSTHWAFSIFAARLMRALVRRDQSLSAEPARYLVEQVVSENPKMRVYAQAAVIKVLYFLKLRTLCKNDEDLLLGNAKNPLKHVEDLPSPVSREWTQKYLNSFAEPVNETTKFRDKTSQGWLVWGDQETYYTSPPESFNPFIWDPRSQEAIDAVYKTISESCWWESFFRHLSQEKDRDYLSTDTLNLLKSLFQIYGIQLLDHVKPTIEQYIGEKDRHKHRAAAEMISGLYRGCKHWPLHDQDRLWQWLGSLLPKIFKECTPDSQPAWQMCVEYMLQYRDPRRAMPLVKYVVETAKENIGRESADQSPWGQSKAQNLLRGALISLNLKFTGWDANSFIQLYFDNIGNDFQEVRSVISEGLADLELLQVHPSFGSVDEMLDVCASTQGSLLSRPELYNQRFDKLTKDLARWRQERKPMALGASQYDRAATTALLWILTTLGDHRNSAMAGEVIAFIPDIFSMLELHDNRELSTLARSVLTKISTYPFTSGYVHPLVTTLVHVTRSSTDSWRARLDSLLVLQVVFFQNLFYLDQSLIQQIIELLFDMLRDKHLEVREMSSTTLSGIVRCSQRQLIKTLKDRFTKTVLSTVLSKRGSSDYDDKILTLHSGILGATALLAAFPYDVPEWMPSLIVETVAQHTEDPVPISTTVRRCAADFKRTHQDTWSEDQYKFGEYLTEVNDFTLGRSDYFA